jgi:hypothetical protein
MATPIKLQQLVNQAAELAAQSDDALIRSVSATQQRLYKEIISILRTFIGSDFRLTNPQTDLQLFYELRRKLREAFASTGYTPSIEKYLASFDAIEGINKEKLIVSIGDQFKKGVNALNMAAERELIAGTIANKLINPVSIDNAFIAPLQRIVYSSVNGGLTYNEAEQTLREIVLGTPGKKQGFVLRYTTQLTRDGINQYQGEIMQKATKELSLNAFRYVGSLLPKDSRLNCIELVNGSGAFTNFAIKPGEYLIRDLDLIIAIAETRPGWIPDTTPANFFVNRGGYNCRHEAIPFIYRG